MFSIFKHSPIFIFFKKVEQVSIWWSSMDNFNASVRCSTYYFQVPSSWMLILSCVRSNVQMVHNMFWRRVSGENFWRSISTWKPTRGLSANTYVKCHFENCTLYTLYITHCTFCIVHWTFYIRNFKLYIVENVLYIVHLWYVFQFLAHVYNVL